MQRIYEIAENEEIYIAYEDLQAAGDIQGLYTIHPRAGPVIVLDKSLLCQPKLHRCVAAHELGHHFYPPRTDAATAASFCRGNYFTSSQIKITANQDEQKALRWATELLMPSEEVWTAIEDGCNTPPLLAEQFGVCEWFARFRIDQMQENRKGQAGSIKKGET